MDLEPYITLLGRRSTWVPRDLSWGPCLLRRSQEGHPVAERKVGSGAWRPGFTTPHHPLPPPARHTHTLPLH